MHSFDDIPTLDQLMASAEEHYKQDEEARALAKLEREKLLDNERNGGKAVESKLLRHLINISFP
jgi:hypothetical protein